MHTGLWNWRGSSKLSRGYQCPFLSRAAAEALAADRSASTDGGFDLRLAAFAGVLLFADFVGVFVLASFFVLAAFFTIVFRR